MGRFEEFAREMTTLLVRYERIRTKIGTGEEKGTPEFFKIIEIFIELAKGIIAQCHNQKKQTEICINYVDGFEAKYEQLISLITEHAEKLAVIESERDSSNAVKTWFGTTSETIIKTAKTLGAIGVIITVAAFWIKFLGAK